MKMNTLIFTFGRYKTRKFMDPAEKRNYIHSYLDQLTDKDIDAVFDQVKSAVEKDLVLSPRQEEEIKRRVQLHKNGESKSYTWAEMRGRIRLSS